LRIIYYTSGISGSGRLVRGIAISNAFKRKKIDCEFIIINSSSFAYLCDQLDIKHIEIPIENEDQLSKEKFANSVLYKTITELNPDILIVDLLWFSVFNFIEKLKCKKIFICHQVDDIFFSPQLLEKKLQFNEKQYDLLLAIEPFDSKIKFKNINPIILRNRDEIFPRKDALIKLNLDPSKDVCLYAFNNRPGDFDKYKKKYSYLENVYQMVYTSNYSGGLFPVIDYFNAFDFIVCAAGYNQFWEVIYFKKEAVFEHVPLNFSSTERRLEECIDYQFDENGADQLVDIISNQK
jgi:hypothetical protein